MKDTAMGDARFVQDSATGVVFIRIAVPDLKVQKCLQFQLEHTVWQAKQRVLASFAKELRDPLNYGLYLPPANGRAGKFMEEERLLSEYPIQGPIGFLEFKYKRRVYKMMLVNERKMKQINSKTKLKTFMELVRNGNTQKLNKLTLKGLDPNFHDQDNGETPLTVAVTLGRSTCREVIIGLISGGAHLDYRNRQGMTALHRGAIVGNVEAIRTMLDLGASPNCKDARDLTPLYYSVFNDDTLQECTYMLLHERARIGVCDEQGWYEIHQACKYGRVQHLEHLVFYGADMDVRNSCGNTPLHICALNNQEACTRLLLFRGADVTLCNYNNQTASQVAALAGNSAIAALINAHNPDDVVPYREIPQYSDRRKGASLTPSLRALLRSRSDPRINVVGLDSRSTSTASSPFGGVVRRHHVGVDSDSACSISVASSGSVTGVTDHGMYEGRTMTGREGYFPGGHLSEVNIRRAGSMGDVNVVTRATNQRNTLAPLINVKRNQQPRVVMLHRSSEGYGFVLRGAKSKLPTGGSFNDFTPTAEYPALQYLDSVDPGSQADRTGLRAGDFILEINGENVVRASHERVVHLIRSSSDILTLKVVTVIHVDPTPSDWHAYPDSGAMTLPSRKKIVAPLPPQRDPQTSLSYSKASSKSMAEGLAEIEKLDATIAEFEGQEAARSRSLHALHAADEHKLASVRASHALHAADEHKLASVRASHALKRVSVMDYEGLMAGDPETAQVNGSQTFERSKSTPDIHAAVDKQHNEHSLDSSTTGSWRKNQAPAPPPGGQYKSGTSGTPNMAHRMPPTPEIVRINTAGRNSTYGVVSANSDTQNKTESHYDSSFRPENNTASVEKGIAANGNHSVLIKNNYSNHNGDKGISFADERVAENAHKFIQKYPNATLLVTADVHTDKIDVKKDKDLYEPEPDYDDNDDKSANMKANKFSNTTSVAVTTPRLAKASDDPRNKDVVRQNKAAVTVISITSGANKDGYKQISSSQSSPHLTNSAKSSPMSIRMHENTALTSPAQSISSSRRSSGVVMTTPSQPSSVESSRRSSIQSNFSGDNDKNGRSCTPSSTSTITLDNSRNVEPECIPPPPPPPPLDIVVGRPSSSTEMGSISSLRRRPNDADTFAVLQNRVSTDDILAAVAERRNRLQTDGPRLSEVKTLPMSKSTHELNQEALKAAVAKRKSRLEQVEDTSVVSEIEARLNRNKKLQAAKFFGSDANKSDGSTKKEEIVTSPPVLAPVTAVAEGPVGNSSVKTKDETVRSELQNKQISPNVPAKTYQNIDKSLGEKQPNQANSPDPAKSVIDFRSVLKPVDVKGTSPAVVQSKASVTPSTEVTATPAPGANITTIVMTKSNSGKVQAPPPPPPAPAISSAVASVPSASAAKSATALPALVTSKSAQKVGETNPAVSGALSPTSNSNSASSPASKTSSPADYIALAERARQEYLKKKASGHLQAHIEKKGPVEITPNRKSVQRNKPTLPSSPTSAAAESSSQVKLESGVKDGQVSVQDRIKGLQPEKNLANVKTSLAGVTEDHSYTDVTLSNGTLRKSPPKNSALPPLNMGPAPPPGFGDNDGNSSTTKAVIIDILSPPTSNMAGSPDSALSVPSFGQDDAASFVSSASSLSTWSSEHGEGTHYSRPRDNIKDFIAHSPPPPPDFGDFSLGDQDSFIPPPPEFLEIDSNANETKAMDNNSKPSTSKKVSEWTCMDVLDWLDSLNLPQYRISFAKAQINGNKLMNMGRNEFINLGVTQVGHRMNLERSVKKLNIGISTNL